MSKNLLSHYIDGQWIHGKGQAFHSINPTNLEIFWEGHKATHEEIVSAVTAAQKASVYWSRTTVEARIEHLKQFAHQLNMRAEALTHCISDETGKPLWESRTETQAVIGKIELSIRAYHERMSSHFIEEGNARNGVTYKAHGVMIVLGPFNFPAHLSNGHIVPALLAGNTVVYKPSELTPGVAAFMMDCWHESGLPEGVLNLIQGDATSAQGLINQDIQGLLFTGSYRAGLHIHQQLSARPEVITALEMGGNNPLIVADIEDIPAAVYQTVLSSFITAGQRCSCARRLFIPRNALGDRFLDALKETTRNIIVGPPSGSQEPFFGPVIRLNHAKMHLQSQKNLIELGAKPIELMQQNDPMLPFLTPGILDMSTVLNPPDEEIFAPLIQLYRYDSFDEALVRANQTRYGLTASLLSDKKEQYDLFYTHIRAGLIYWNRATTGASSALPFGGVGFSGNHRPSAFFATDYCAYPIANMTQTTVTLPTTRLPGIQVSL